MCPYIFYLIDANYAEFVQSCTELDRLPEDLHVVVVQEQQLQAAPSAQQLSPALAGQTPVLFFAHGQFAEVLEAVDAAELTFEFVATDQDQADANFCGLEPLHYLGAFVVFGVDTADVAEHKLDFSIDFVVFEVFGGELIELQSNN